LNLPAPPHILADHAALFTQNERMLQAVWPADCGFDTSLLLPQHLIGKEALSTPYRYQLEVMSHDAHLPAKYLLGLPVGINVLQSDGSTRAICGIINRVRNQQSNGGNAGFLLEIIPAPALLMNTHDSRIFLGKSVPEILILLLEELRQRHPGSMSALKIDQQLTKIYNPRDLTTQYRETIHEFFTRLAREEGISYRFEHAIENGIPQHTIILFDDAYSLPMLEANNGEVRFHRTDATEETDGLDRWESERSTQPARVTLNTWNYQPAANEQVSETTWINNGETVPQLEDYDPQSSFYGDGTELSEYAKRRQQAHDLKTKTFYASGTPRNLYPGANFTLTGHPVHDQDVKEQRQFVVQSQSIDAWNNLPDGPTEKKDKPPFRTDLALVRRGIPILPEYSHTEHTKPRTWGPQTAIVVGPPDAVVHTNEHGEIRAQYSWQRKPDHDLERTGGNANFDDKSSFWIRVAHDIAGDHWGSQWIPRVGQEILIEYIEGDIDRPVCVKVLHNGNHENPHFSGAGSLPANKALSGTKTQEHHGQGYNELLFDDTTNELRTKLSSEHAKSQLNMGYLTHPSTEGKGEPRGAGIEIRTDASLALRGAQGLLITTEARYKATGKQLERQALTTAMNLAQELTKIYGDLSNTHQADYTELDELKKLIDKIETWEKGSNTDKSGNSGGQPIIAISAPSGMAMSSGEEMAITAATNLDIVTQQSMQITSGKNLLARVKDRISLFAHKLGIKLVAASGKVEIQAHSDNIEITAAKNIYGTALEEIVFKAKKMTIMTDGASLEIGGGGILSKTSGVHTRHAGKHAMEEPAGVNVELPNMPHSEDVANWLDLSLQHPDLAPVPGADYKVKFHDGTMRSGKLDNNGRARLEGVPLGPAQVYFGEDPQPPAMAPVSAKIVDRASIEQDLRRAGYNADEIDIAALLQHFSGRA